MRWGNLENLRRYAIQGQGSRPGQLTNFITLHEESGELGLVGERKEPQRYAGQIIRGREMVRMCALGGSMQKITREARAVACLGGYLELDISNCLQNCTPPIPR